MSENREMIGVNRRPWVRKCLRAGGVASVVGALLAPIGVHSAAAGVQEAASSGASLLEAQLGDELIEAQEIEINGQRVFVSSSVTDLGLGEVLDRFSIDCSGSDAAEGPGVQLLRRALIQRAQDDHEGHLACLALRAELHTAPQLADAVRRFGQSGDLAALGAARVARVRALPDGGSHVLAFWTEGAFRPFELLAPREVAFPSLASGVSPPAGAVQDLSLAAPGHHYGLHGYRVPLPLDEALEHYERGLKAAGFTALDSAAAGLEWKEPGKDARVFVRGAASAYVVGLEGDGGTRVLVMHSGAGRGDALEAAAPDSEVTGPEVTGPDVARLDVTE